MRWIKASDKTPPPKVDVVIKEYSGTLDIGFYSDKDGQIHTSSDLGPLSVNQVEWLDESESSSPLPLKDIVQEMEMDLETLTKHPDQTDLAKRTLEYYLPKLKQIAEGSESYWKKELVEFIKWFCEQNEVNMPVREMKRIANEYQLKSSIGEETNKTETHE